MWIGIDSSRRPPTNRVDTCNPLRPIAPNQLDQRNVRRLYQPTERVPRRIRLGLSEISSQPRPRTRKLPVWIGASQRRSAAPVAAATAVRVRQVVWEQCWNDKCREERPPVPLPRSLELGDQVTSNVDAGGFSAVHATDDERRLRATTREHMQLNGRAPCRSPNRRHRWPVEIPRHTAAPREG